MAMNLGQLRAKVRSILQEPVPARWSNTDIDGYLNDGLQDMAKIAERLRTKEVAVTAGTATITFPDDLLILHSVYWGDSSSKTELLLAKDNLPADDLTQDTPVYFYLLDGSIRLRPIPNEDKNIYFVYYWKPKIMLDDTDMPELEGTENALISYAVYRAYFEDGDPRAALWEQDYAKQQLKWLAIENQNNPDIMQVKEVW